ncbi:amidohydrolase family protein [Massilia sp. H6]|uniref:amidohydrolase family protein n=1 Tax=Massilia sp. H6 TaxID=2970464 RepID=UPI002168FF2A|nr:amidohydrolase family protein [Massilia sp. H6]UVW30719.1 amidohydrolase family protein [Massilia sp. H6]
MIQFQNAVAMATDQVDRADDKRIVLSGDIVTMNASRDIIRQGRLCIQGNEIVAVLGPGDQIPADFTDAARVDTKGTIYPGLFDLHNHLPYNMIPLWQVDRPFKNRREWQAVLEYYPAVRAPFGLLNEHPDLDYRRAIVRFTECRNLLGGVTTGHGMGMTKGVTYQGLMRNIEQPETDELPRVKSQTADMKPEDINKMVEWTGEGRPFIYHLSEGIDEHAHERLLDLQQAPGALNRHLVCIHAVGVYSEDFPSLKQIAGIVWSPTSNLLLYGQTCKIEAAKNSGVPIAIGADWSPSGCKNLLGELKVARAVSRHHGTVLNDMELVAGVTCVPATMIGWAHRLGSIGEGKWADLLILEGQVADPYAHLVEARESSIAAVIIDGRIRLGQADGLVIGEPLSSEEVIVGGKRYVLDLAESSGDGVGGMRLDKAINKIDDGLQRLPELEAAATALWGGDDREKKWQFEDEMHEDSFEALFLRDDRMPAKSMRLGPLTSLSEFLCGTGS